MNFPKAFLKIGEITFLEKLIAEYKKVVSEIVVVLNNDLTKPQWEQYINGINGGCRIILNHYPEKGKFYSLQLGAKNTTTDFCFIQNVDCPTVNAVLLQKMLDNKNMTGLTLPTFEGKNGHPVLVSKEILKKIRLTCEINLNLKLFYSLFSKKYVEVHEEAILYNINTPEDYKRHIFLN